MSVIDWWKNARIFFSKGDFKSALERLEMVGMMDRYFKSQ